jgi:hypothetical protein
MIENFVEKTSVERTLVTPDIQLKEFRSLKKADLDSYFGAIETVDIKLSGKINENCLLVRFSK